MLRTPLFHPLITLRPRVEQSLDSLLVRFVILQKLTVLVFGYPVWLESVEFVGCNAGLNLVSQLAVFVH